jgi:hypothetical protein
MIIINQTMVNHFTYTVFYVIAEPVDNPDPNQAGLVSGEKLNK